VLAPYVEIRHCPPTAYAFLGERPLRGWDTRRFGVSEEVGVPKLLLVVACGVQRPRAEVMRSFGRIGIECYAPGFESRRHRLVVRNQEDSANIQDYSVHCALGYCREPGGRGSAPIQTAWLSRAAPLLAVANVIVRLVPGAWGRRSAPIQTAWLSRAAPLLAVANVIVRLVRSQHDVFGDG